MRKQNWFARIWSWSKTNRKKAIVIFVVAIAIVYWISRSIIGTNTTPQYTLSMARIGTITQTVTGSGQVSASNQTDIQSQVSGTIKSINVSVGQAVKAGELIAVIDYSNALISLQNAKISLAKLTQPAKASDIELAKNNLTKAYESGFNAVAGVFLDLPTILSGMKDMLYGQSGYLSDQNSTFLTPSGRDYRNTAGQAYDIAYDKYQKALSEYKSLSRSSATSSIDKLIADTYETIKAVAEATSHAQNAINFIKTTQSTYLESLASTALTNVTNWSSQANADVSSIVSAQNTILSSKDSLQTLINGSDDLDIQSARLNLEQAERTYGNYFIRAPYDGVIGRIPVSVYGQAGSGTTIATIIGQQKVASISLNEVDAAKVKVGQPVKITLDAVDGLNVTGTVSVVDQVGTVSSGVVSYAVKIAIDTEDPRIKPGMSVNTTIITLQENKVLIVPSSAIKKTGGENYVQSFDQAMLKANLPLTSISPKVSLGTTTKNWAGSTTRDRNVAEDSTYSTTTNNIGASTRFNGSAGTYSRVSGQQPITISTSVAPTKIVVTVGDSDDTNTEIVSGLNRGQFVITKTTATSVAQTSTAPNILSGIGGARNSGGLRTTGSATRVGN